MDTQRGLFEECMYFNKYNWCKSSTIDSTKGKPDSRMLLAFVLVHLQAYVIFLEEDIIKAFKLKI